jgi:ParB family chromosome partitioning protein
MSPRRAGLGRGLDALIPGGEPHNDSRGEAVLQIAVDAIDANPRQPRLHFDADELADLAQSIREHGVLQPLIVTTGPEAGRYTLVAGERRLLAARQAGLAHVPVLARDAGEQTRLELALIENVQRADLSPLELAEAFLHLHNEFGLKHEQIAARVGKSREAVSNTLRLLKLTGSARQALADGRISEGHARALLILPSERAQDAALETVLGKELSVRRTEELVRQLKGERPPAAPRPASPPEVSALQTRLEGALGTRVRLRRNRQGRGAIVIHFYSDEELDALTTKLTEGKE